MQLVDVLVKNKIVTGPLPAHHSVNNSTLSVIKRWLKGEQADGTGSGARHFVKGSELHGRILETITHPRVRLYDDEELAVRSWSVALGKNKVFRTFLQGAKTEQLVYKIVNGVLVRGTLDIIKGPVIGDIKTTAATTYNEFIKSCRKYDYFRQAWLYMQLVKATDFIFFGVSKKGPLHEVFIVNVRDHKELLDIGKEEARFLLDFYKRYGLPTAKGFEAIGRGDIIKPSNV